MFDVRKDYKGTSGDSKLVKMNEIKWGIAACLGILSLSVLFYIFNPIGDYSFPEDWENMTTIRRYIETQKFAVSRQGLISVLMGIGLASLILFVGLSIYYRGEP